MNDSNAKQQIVDKIKSNSNILVTVSTNPSVDELSAALGLTLLLNKMNKHATAVFSGAIPPAITFLDPQKTFENTVDSLRDFIIALDKEKADHLRYKVDGDVVKIFITPYRTTISSDDLDFSQGDYNVELVLALGVKNPDHLDGALSAHGRILHDAVVATISVGQEKSELGSVDWREENASSLSEMLVSLCDALKSDKTLLDDQTATAFLTGIVAATDRFSNDRTSSRVMTMAAQLMSAGANQQLIASKLEEAHEIGVGAATTSDSSSSEKSENSDGTVDLSEGESTKLNKKGSKSKAESEEKLAEEPEKPKEEDGSLSISHEKQGSIDEVAEATEREHQEAAAKKAEDELEKQNAEVTAEQEEDPGVLAEKNLTDQLAAKPATANTPSVADLQKDLAAASAEADTAAEEAANAPLVGAATSNEWQNNETPSMGGTLNATAEQAAEDKRRSELADQNHTILNHNSGNNYVGDSTPTFQSPLNAASQPEEEQPMVDPFKDAGVPPVASYDSTPPPPTYIEPPTPTPPATTLADIDKQNRAPHEDARAAVDAAFGAVPFTPQTNPAEVVGGMPASADNTTLPPVASLPPLPPLPDFSTLPPMPPAPGAGAQPMGAVPPEKLGDIFTPAPANSSPVPQSNDPAQFKIPGQS